MHRHRMIAAAAGALIWVVGSPAPAWSAGNETVAVSPSQGLVDNQNIDVTGTGWSASSTLRVTELWIDPNTGGGDIAAGRTDTAETGSSGGLDTTYAVQRFVEGHDCARLQGDERCQVVVTQAGTATLRSAGIVFAPK